MQRKERRRYDAVASLRRSDTAMRRDRPSDQVEHSLVPSEGAALSAPGGSRDGVRYSGTGKTTVDGVALSVVETELDPPRGFSTSNLSWLDTPHAG